MLQTPITPDSQTLLLQLPTSIALHVTPEQFTILAAANRDLLPGFVLILRRILN